MNYAKILFHRGIPGWCSPNKMTNQFWWTKLQTSWTQYVIKIKWFILLELYEVFGGWCKKEAVGKHTWGNCSGEVMHCLSHPWSSTLQRATIGFGQAELWFSHYCLFIDTSSDFQHQHSQCPALCTCKITSKAGQSISQLHPTIQVTVACKLASGAVCTLLASYFQTYGTSFFQHACFGRRWQR